MEGTTCEIVNLRAVGYGTVPKPRLPESEDGGEAGSSHAVVDEHEVYFGGEWLPTKIFDRSKLVPGNRVEGPAIVTEFDSTTVVLSGFAAEVDRYLNLIIRPANGQGGVL
jgi:N-methylhydantoinase A